MGFVKTAAEVARIEAAIGAPRFGGAQMLSVEFLIDPAYIAEALPPPLEPAAEPRMRAMVSRFGSNCVGDFDGGCVYVTCAHEGLEGEYNLFQYMDTDQATIFGRDVFGEPKKMAKATLRARGGRMHGTIERHGVALITLEGELTKDNGPFQATRESYNIKSRPAADGHGLEEDPILTRAHYETEGQVFARASAGSPSPAPSTTRWTRSRSPRSSGRPTSRATWWRRSRWRPESPPRLSSRSTTPATTTGAPWRRRGRAAGSWRPKNGTGHFGATRAG